MILPAFRRSVHDNNIYALYGMIVAQVRLGVFYTAYGIPDTVQGRFELLVLHLVLVLRRLGREPQTAKAAGWVRREFARTAPVRRLLPGSGRKSSRDGRRGYGRSAEDAALR